ncbi:TetR/AcrR family transcriptional regulator [Fodinicola feengrottensis]|uniref:TetR/AcrR family transcriptional regulator n=1 Tax=Fodinicola feengrottensis TaxID=435914 RepID=A0ABP4T6C8_9ACTN
MRTRLSTQDRRRQLIAIGAELFASRPYEQVWIEEVAEIAQVSRGLLYHYFATKKDFFMAVVEVEVERLLRLTAPDPGLPLPLQLNAGLEAYLDYAQNHKIGFQLMHRSAINVDEEIRAIYDKTLATHERRIVAALGASNATAGIAVRGWLAFIESVCLDWLDNPDLTRDQVRDLCARTLLAAVGFQET